MIAQYKKNAQAAVGHMPRLMREAAVLENSLFLAALMAKANNANPEYVARLVELRRRAAARFFRRKAQGR